MKNDRPDKIVAGLMTGSAVGLILKELVRRAMVEITKQRFAFESHEKMGYSGMPDDVFTSADTATQEIYLRGFRECFPGYGVIGEEDGLNIPCTIPGEDLYFTIDPLDGTKAYKRMQSYGIGTMIALVDGKTDEVLSAYIGDPFSMEVFGYRPGGTKAWRINKLDVNTQLPDSFGDEISLLTCGIAREHKQETPICQHLLNSSKKCMIEGGSIGITFSRLWTGECTYVLLVPTWVTPWDETPLIGISRLLGYEYWTVNETGNRWIPLPMKTTKEKFYKKTETLVAHKTFHDWIANMAVS